MSKFFDLKDALANIEEIVIDLIADNNMQIDINPKNDIQIKLATLGKPGYFNVVFNNLLAMEDCYNIIADKISMIDEYLMPLGYISKISLKEVKGWDRNNKYFKINKGYDIKTLEIDEFDDYIAGLKNKIEWIKMDINKEEDLNESLPNQKTVDQLKMVAKLSKKTDIGNRIPDENGSNMRYMRNPIDNLESREDYDKKNKDYIPSWNLKHLLSPFKGKDKHKIKIKRVSESQSQMIEFDNNKYAVVYGEDIVSDTNFGVYKSYEDNKSYLVAKNDIDALDSDNFTFEGLAVTKDYYSLAKSAKDKYIEVKSDADSVRYSDEQYEDPSEWYAFEEYDKYYKEGRWNNIFWDFIL